MNKNSVLKTVITFLSIIAIGGTLVYGQEVDGKMVASGNLLSILEDSENRVTILFQSITDGGGDVPTEAEELMAEAQQLHGETQDLVDGEEYEACIIKATEALNKYGKALGKAHIAEAEVMEPLEAQVEDETKKMIGLSSAIEQARDRIDRLREIADELDEDDELEIDTSQARNLLNSAEDILDELAAVFDSGELEAPGNYLGEANGLIGEATGMLRSIGQPRKRERAQQFIQQTINRVGELEQNMNQMFMGQGLPNHAVSEEFMEIVSGLNGLDPHTDLKDAIEQLKTYVRDINRVGQNLGDGQGIGEETVAAFNTQSRLGAIIEAYRNKLNAIEDEELVASLIALLDEAESLLSESEEALISGDQEYAGELMDAVEQLLDEFNEAFNEVFMKQMSGFSLPIPDQGNSGKRPTG
jgi:hypothetical protein